MNTARITVIVGLLPVTLSLTGFCQSIVQGNTISQGSQVDFPFTHNVQIMAFSPPAYGTPDYNNFLSNVMTQSSVDGVTLEIVWSNVEQSTTTNPSSTSCGVPSDVCQQDAVGQYHVYSWSAYDAAASSTNPLGIYSWFNSFGGVKKKVNLILSGINAGGSGIDTATPWYVTSSPAYVSLFTPQRQDVLNGVKDCNPGVPWTGTSAASFAGPGITITVNTSPQTCCSTGTPYTAGTIVTGDMIWVGATATSGNDLNYEILSRYGTSVTVSSSTQFTYTASSTVVAACLTCFFISAGQSSPVPYEQPYIAAWKAFMAAANLHFNSNYAGAGSQLGYVRSGTWSGGESFAYCTAGGLWGGLGGILGVYAFNSAPDVTKNTWTLDYQAKVNYIASLSPTMTRYWPIDTIDGSTFYPDTMAPYAVTAGNAYGYTNGFGSQGLSLLDAQNGCGSTAADWCNLFTGGGSLPAYDSYSIPLELQQISISNPDITYGMCNSTNCGTPPNHFSGNLRGWLPFAVNHGTTVIEMYYQDLGLAYDTNYCTGTGVSTCSAGSYHCYVPAASNVTPSLECGWFNEVGQGGTCTGGCYSTTIDQAHGLHQ